MRSIFHKWFTYLLIISICGSVTEAHAKQFGTINRLKGTKVGKKLQQVKPPNTPPQALSYSPGIDATDVDPATTRSLSVTFNEDTLTRSAPSVSILAGAEVSRWTSRWTDTRTVTISPQSGNELKSSTRYEVTVTGAKDKAGAVAANVSFSFQTKDAPPPPSPDAEFEADVREGTGSLTVSFTDRSTNTPNSWLWNFGDGGRSQDQNPTYTYRRVGTYTVSLTVRNVGNAPDTERKVDFIEVKRVPSPPQARFNLNIITGNAPLEVRFTDQSTHIAQRPNQASPWEWDFGDGNSSTDQSPTHTFQTAGTYPVKLKVTNLDGTSETSRTVTVARIPAPPVANFSTSVSSGDAPLIVQFTDLSGNNPRKWDWSFGDGGSSEEQNPQYTFEGEGVWNVRLTVTNDDGTTEISRPIAVSTTKTPPLASFVTDRSSGGAPLRIQFTDVSSNQPSSWAWDFGDGNSSEEQHPVHIYETTGDYTARLTVRNSDGESESTRIIVVSEGVVSASPIAVGSTPSAADLSVEEPRKYYTLNIIEETRIMIDLTGNFNTMLRLYRGASPLDAVNENLEVQNDDREAGNSSSGSYIERDLSPGTYLVEAASYQDGAQGSFALSITREEPRYQMPYHQFRLAKNNLGPWNLANENTCC
jgi:PKD repeat protein